MEFSIVSFAIGGEIWYTILLIDLRFRPKGNLYRRVLNAWETARGEEL